ncbi:RAD51L3, RAD51D [Phaffia rhodozyma]|uniref:RAD51L3, RAD51D n=1 Tax=Phaffia rhodozyma TaxID=264483 RepID=A0A0F7SUB5_PHARH|nr:RAD51L3, RAD51D [Phaffia rhodozyma]
MRLKRLVPLISPELHRLISLLAQIEITQSQTLVFTPSDEILSLLGPIISNLATEDDHLSSISLTSIEQLKDEVTKVETPEFIRGDRALDQEKMDKAGRTSRWVGIGVKPVDELMGVISSEGQERWDGVGIVEVSGTDGVGKSLFSLHLVLNHLVRHPKSEALWVDTDRSFEASRALNVLSHKFPGISSTRVLGRLQVKPIFGLPSFIQALSDLEKPYQSVDREGQSSTSTKPKGRFTLLVVDSLTKLYGDLVISAGSAGLAALVSHMHRLSAISHRQGITSILINDSIRVPSQSHTPSSNSAMNNQIPALGTEFTYLTDMALWLETTKFTHFSSTEREVIIQIMKNRVGPARRSTSIKTDGTVILGLQDRPRSSV